jgi:hypothetical protein
MVLGVVVADPVRHFAQKNSAGLLHVQTVGQGEFITWQIATFAVLAGGVIAGSSSGGGLWHGFLAGALGGAGVMGVCVKQGAAPPPVDYWLTRVALDGMPIGATAVVTAVAGGILILGILGGWLGGAMFLPLAPESMRRRLPPD